MKKLLLLTLLLSAPVLAAPLPIFVDLQKSSESIYGYKVDVTEFDGQTSTVVFSDVMFYNRNYTVCLTPVLFGLNQDGTHRLDSNNVRCHIILK